MKFSYNWLKELHPKIPSPEKAADLLTFHAFEVESAEKKGNDHALDIAILPNRLGDAASHFGVAKELLVIGGATLDQKPLKLTESNTKAKDILSVSIEAKKAVPRYSARIVSGIRVKEAPAFIKERLMTCGLRPINAIVDITNYVMLETGQPLHAFDLERLHGSGKKEIIVRMAKAGEVMKPLGEGAELKLVPDDIVITDPKGVIALGGIKGGMGSEISEKTTAIVIEAANFDPAAIRKTSKRLTLRTDASYRFEHGIDVERVDYALARAASLIQTYAGGEILKGVVEAGRTTTTKRSVPLAIANIARLLGVPIPEAPAVSILKRLGCEVKKRAKGSYAVTPPSYRNDLEIEEDLVEEVGRIWGYEKIPAVLPIVQGGVPEKNDRTVFEDEAKQLLAGFGYTEAHLSGFVGEKDLTPYGITPERFYALENPINPDSAYLSCIPSIQYIASVAENLKMHDAVRIFGVGRAFIKTPEGPVERPRLIIALAEAGSDGRASFYELKGVVDRLLEAFRISDYAYDDAVAERHNNWAHPHRVAEVTADGVVLGVVAEVAPHALNVLKSRARISIAEIDLGRFVDVIEREQMFQTFSRFPAVRRDVAIIVPESTKIEAVTNVIEKAGGALLVDTDLFDDFQDEGMRARGVQSLAFHLIFQSPDRTLTDEEVNQLHQKVIQALKQNSWEVRE